jgi:hypothetical protein
MFRLRPIHLADLFYRGFVVTAAKEQKRGLPPPRGPATGAATSHPEKAAERIGDADVESFPRAGFARRAAARKLQRGEKSVRAGKRAGMRRASPARCVLSSQIRGFYRDALPRGRWLSEDENRTVIKNSSLAHNLVL